MYICLHVQYRYYCQIVTFEGTSLNIQRVSNLSTFFFKFLIPQRSGRDIIKNVYHSSCTVPLLLSDCNFRRNVIEYTTCFEFVYIFFLNFSFHKDLVEILLKMYITLHVQYRYCCQIVTFEGTSLNIQRVSNLSTFFFKFLIPKRSGRDIIKNVYHSSCTVPLLLSDCNFRRNVIEYTTCFEFVYIFF